MTSDRFTYQKDDIQIKKSQCNFCKHNYSDEEGDSKSYCFKYPEGKPADIEKTVKRCPYLEY